MIIKDNKKYKNNSTLIFFTLFINTLRSKTHKLLCKIAFNEYNTLINLYLFIIINSKAITSVTDEKSKIRNTILFLNSFKSLFIEKKKKVNKTRNCVSLKWTTIWLNI